MAVSYRKANRTIQEETLGENFSPNMQAFLLRSLLFYMF